MHLILFSTNTDECFQYHHLADKIQVLDLEMQADVISVYGHCCWYGQMDKKACFCDFFFYDSVYDSK